MKHLLAVLLLLVLLPLSSALAQQPAATPTSVASASADQATKEEVRQLFELMKLRKMFNSVMDVVKQQMPGMMDGVVKQTLPDATPEQIQQFNDFMTTEMTRMWASMPVDEMLDAMVPAYQHHLTHSDVQDLIHFYSSPTGQKLLAETPAITQEYMQQANPVMQRWIMKEMQQMKENAEKFAKTMKEKDAGAPAKKS